MENQTSAYETRYIIDPIVGEEGIKALVQKINDLIAVHVQLSLLTSGATDVLRILSM